MGQFDDINGKIRGNEWDISMTLMGNFEDIGGKIRGH